MTRRTPDPARFLPFPPLDFQVLALLSAQALHGYGIVQASTAQFPGSPGSPWGRSTGSSVECSLTGSFS